MNNPPAGVRQRQKEEDRERNREEDYILCQISELLFDYGFYTDGKNGLMMDIQNVSRMEIKGPNRSKMKANTVVSTTGHVI